MSSNTDSTLNPADEQVASTEPKLAKQETEPVTNPQAAQTESTSEGKKTSSYTDMASDATASATTAAAGMKDSVFSMFGGGAKKEKRVEPEDDANEPSGSSKARKDAEDPEVRNGCQDLRCGSLADVSVFL